MKNGREVGRGAVSPVVGGDSRLRLAFDAMLSAGPVVGRRK